MKSNKGKYLFVFFSSFLFSLIFFYIFGFIYCDEVWGYGFSYNLAKGMMIYRDYNVLQMPLYFIIASYFIKIFGSYMIVMHIFDSLLFALMMVMIYKMISWKSLIMLPFFCFWWPSGYNLLCLFFLILIIFLVHEKKDNDYLIAFIVGLCFITKQNMGILLFIPMLFYSKKKIKSICCFIIPFLILSIYLIYNDAIYQFIDYCFLGMIDFGETNKLIYPLNFSLFIVNVVVILYWLFKSEGKDKELFYVLMFQLIMYPIFDTRHYYCASFPMIYLILKIINYKYVLKLIGFAVYCFYLVLFLSLDFKINLDNSFDYLRNTGDSKILIEEVKKYVGDNENFFFTDYYNYYVKLYYDIPIGQYDLLLSGNVGYNGMNKKFQELDELCSKEKCYFFSNRFNNNETVDVLFGQYKEFYNYIIDNYEKVDSLFEFDVYTNFVD